MIKRMDNKTNRKEKCMLICMLLLGVLFMAPRLILDTIPAYANQDTLFHIIRLSGLKNVWTSPINYELNSTGSLVNAFYPWLTMYPMYIIYFLTGDYSISYTLYYCLLSIAGLYISYFSMRVITREEWPSFCFSIIYVFSSYRFTNVYYRAALGEAISMTFLPLVLCGIYLILFDNYKKWLILSFGITLIAYSHLISLYLTGVFTLVILFISIAFIDNRRERIISFARAILSSILFSSGMLIQLVYYGLNDNLARPEGVTEVFKLHAFSFLQILEKSIFEQYSFYSVGFGIILLIFFGLIYAVSHKSEKHFFPHMLSFLSIILLISTSSLIPWGTISEFSVIGVIQFPWRLNVYITLFAITAFSMYVSKIYNKFLKNTFILFAILTSVLFSCLNYFQLKKEAPEFALSNDFIQNRLIIESLDYIPADYYKYKCENGIVHLLSFHNEDQLMPVSINNGNDLGILVADVRSGEEIVLPTCYFSSLHIYRDDIELPVYKSEIGTAVIKAPYDGDLILDVTNKYDPIIYVFWVISLISFCFITVRYVHNRRIETSAKYNEKCEVNEVI